ncbi:MAG: hypothetical protein NC342_01255 [Pseudoflavonifractor sp.]|nr:hypothetical protein [Alloprevotella sp.]MCM1116151.1 hypothetical protein [Pseudoflavonifractor sp.]
MMTTSATLQSSFAASEKLDRVKKIVIASFIGLAYMAAGAMGLYLIYDFGQSVSADQTEMVR